MSHSLFVILGHFKNAPPNNQNYLSKQIKIFHCSLSQHSANVGAALKMPAHHLANTTICVTCNLLDCRKSISKESDHIGTALAQRYWADHSSGHWPATSKFFWLRILFFLGSYCSKTAIPWNSMTMAFFVFTELANTMKYGGGVLYNLVFTEWRHCVSQNEVWGRGSYITLFSPSDVTEFHRMKKSFSTWHIVI